MLDLNKIIISTLLVLPSSQAANAQSIDKFRTAPQVKEQTVPVPKPVPAPIYIPAPAPIFAPAPDPVPTPPPVPIPTPVTAKPQLWQKYRFEVPRAVNIKYEQADPALTIEKIEKMGSDSGAPIFGSEDNNERRFTVVLSEAAGIAKGRGAAIAKQREAQVKELALKLLSTSGASREVIDSHSVSSGAVNAVTLTNPPTQVLRRLAQDARVLYIEQVTIDRLDGIDSPPQSWGLDRIDQRNQTLDQSFSYTDNGGVDIWVVDSGIRSTHNEFAGRIGSKVNLSTDANTDDCSGHGTHVAGTAAGSTFGVARHAKIHVIKVLSNCGGGFPSTVTQDALNHIYNNASGPSVVNLSLGGFINTTTNLLVKKLTDVGITVVTAAGNNGGSACLRSPASAPSAITVAASDNADGHAFFGSGASNHGGCVDIYAPGKIIKSAWHSGDSATANLHGTSMASPHVAGIAAALTTDSSCESAWKVHDLVVSTATTGAITNPVFTTPNRLAFYEIPSSISPWNDYRALYNSYSQCLIYFDLDTLTGGPLNTCIVPPAPGKTLKAVRVQGHTDAYGEADANMIRSCNYAHVVSKYIRTNFPGVPIVETAHGEANLFIPTGNGTREPLNRRVEVLGLWD